MQGVQTPLAVEWKEANEAWHVAKHGVPFAVAAAVFLDANRLEDQDTREAYDPPRFNTVGIVGDICINVTFAMEGDLAVIISARRASRKERKLYAP